MFERQEQDGIVTLRLAHGKASAVDLELAEGLDRELVDIGASDARAVVITGTGSIFSAGVDLFRVLDGGADYIHSFFPALTRVIRALFMLPKPIVAAANGHAIAGGCIFVAACDYRIMARGNGRIGVPELLVGVPFPAIALEVLRFGIATERLQEVVYTGRTFTADEALDRGLVDEVVEPEALEARALEMARHLGAIPGEAFRLTKQSLRYAAIDRAGRASAVSEADARAVWASPETHAWIRAYLDRTIGKKG